MRRIAAVVAALLVLTAAPSLARSAAAQPAPAAKTDSKQPTSREQIIDEMVAAGVEAAQRQVAKPFLTTLGPGSRGQIVAYLIAQHSQRQGYQVLLQALEARGRKQVGATPNSKGTTSLAMKGLAPKILGVALETGAVTRDVDGTSLTFRATPLGVIKALQNKGLFEMQADYSQSDAAKYASRLSVAATFDASKGPSAGTFTADKHQLTDWSVRFEIINQRDPADYPELWGGLLRSGQPYRAAAETMNDQLSNWREYRTWENQLLADTERVVETPLLADKNVAAAAARFKVLLQAALPKLEKLPNLSAEGLNALDAYVAQLTTLQAAIDNVYEFAGKGSLLTADWSTSRDELLPDLYTVTVVWEHALGAARKTDLTVNGVANFYRREPSPTTKQFKSFDVALQLDHPLGNLPLVSQAALALSTRYSHLPNDTVAAAPAEEGTAAATATTVGTAPKGNIFVAQLKLTIPVKNSGIKVPLSITASNRTELIKEKDVRASFGVTFDLDALVGGLFR